MKRVAAASLLALSLAAPADDAERAAPRAHPSDPFERWNRGVFEFNDKLDEAVLKPVATGYRKVVPSPVRRTIGNFFGNVADAWSAVNHFLQGKPASGLNMTLRVATNTVFGIGGLLDVATEAGLEREEEDFGQTLGRWGIGAGPYIVWPVLGPSSLRDSLGLPLDRSATPAMAFDDAERYGLVGLQLIDSRARLLDATRMLDEIALDRYTFVRNAYLARRRSLVYDGDPPEADDDDAEDDADAPGEPASAPTR